MFKVEKVSLLYGLKFAGDKDRSSAANATLEYLRLSAVDMWRVRATERYYRGNLAR